MKIEVVDRGDKDFDRTFWRGYVSGVSYKKMVDKFGMPQEADSDKLQFEWFISFPEAEAFAHVYDWKTPPDMDVMDVTEWSVAGAPAGRVELAFTCVVATLKGNHAAIRSVFGKKR